MIKKSKKTNKKSTITSKLHFSKIAVIVFVAICIFTITFGMTFKTPLEKLLNRQNTIDSTQITQIDNDGLSIHFINVGQGDCIAIRFPDKKTMLIDAGPTESIGKMLTYLNDMFFGEEPKIFDYLLLTHSDTDHCGGMVKICQNYQVNKIYRPMIYYNYNGNKEQTTQSSPKYCTNYNYYATITAFNDETSNIVFINLTNCNGIEKIQGENYYFDFYSPTRLTKSVAYNDFSPIMVLNYNSKKIMFTGDATTSGTEKYVVDDLPEVDILKVGHHGSKYSTSEDFLSKIMPKIAVIQSGNKYGHPNSETLTRLDYIGAKIYRNDQNGNIIANITSTDAQTNIYIDYNSINYNIKIEYVISGIILLSAYFCFGINPTKTKKINKK